MATKTQNKATSSTRNGSPRVRRPRFVLTDNKMTVEQWAALPDIKPRYELVDGRLEQKMTTTSKHAWTVGRLLSAFTRWGDDRGWIFLPEGVGIKLGQNDGAVADITGFSPGTKLQADASYFAQTPFLVVEVISRSTAKRDRNDKKIGYAQIGVHLYIIADPDNKTLEVYTLENGKYHSPQVLENGEVWQPDELAGLDVKVEKLWFE